MSEKAHRHARTYEITWSDGTRRRLEATQVHTGRHNRSGHQGNFIEFMGPMGLPDGSGWAGRLLLTGTISTAPGGIVSVRDVDVTMPFVTAPPQRRRWRARVRVR